MLPNLACVFRQAIGSMPSFGLSGPFMEAAMDSFGAIFDDPPENEPSVSEKDTDMVRRFISGVYKNARGTIADGFWVDRVIGDVRTPGSFLYEIKDARGKGISAKDICDAFIKATRDRIPLTRDNHPNVRKLEEIANSVSSGLRVADIQRERLEEERRANTADVAKGRLSAAEELHSQSLADADFSISDLRDMAAMPHPRDRSIDKTRSITNAKAVMAGIRNIQGNKSDTLNLISNVGINVPLKPGGRMERYIAGFDAAATKQDKAREAFYAIRLLCKIMYNAWTLAVYGPQASYKYPGAWINRGRKLKAAIDAVDSRGMLEYAMKSGDLPIDAWKLASIYAKAKSAAANLTYYLNTRNYFA